MRTFRLNFEVAALLFGTPANRTLANAYERDLGESKEVTPEVLAGYSFLERLGQASARLFLRCRDAGPAGLQRFQSETTDAATTGVFQLVRV